MSLWSANRFAPRSRHGRSLVVPALAAALIASFSSGAAAWSFKKLAGLDACARYQGYVDRGDGTIGDPRSGLIWFRCGAGQTWSAGTCGGKEEKLSWYSAMAYAKNADFAGYGDWRLPTNRELRSLVDEKCVPPITDLIGAADYENQLQGLSAASLYYMRLPQGDDTGVFRNGVETPRPLNRSSMELVRLVRAGEAAAASNFAAELERYRKEIETIENARNPGFAQALAAFQRTGEPDALQRAEAAANSRLQQEQLRRLNLKLARENRATVAGPIAVEAALRAAAAKPAAATRTAIDPAMYRQAEAGLDGLNAAIDKHNAELDERRYSGGAAVAGTAAAPQPAGNRVLSIKEWGPMSNVPRNPLGYDVKCANGYGKTIWRSGYDGNWYFKDSPITESFVAKGELRLEDAARQLCR